MKSIREFKVKVLQKDGSRNSLLDAVAVEEPLEIRLSVDGFTLRIATTMRTPGNDKELALGFLWSEGLIRDIESIQSVKRSTDPRLEVSENLIVVELSAGTRVAWSRLNRRKDVQSSCGICGRQSLQSLKNLEISQPRGAPWPRDLSLGTFLEQLSSSQNMFRSTGGVHASGLFHYDGNLICLREDVGRHNALDKVVGWSLDKKFVPAEDSILLVSGRISFELVQKALLAGIPNLVGIGAPSSLAIELAEEFDLTLLGFLRENSVNVYSGDWRIS
ncbi:MAG: formate dehydrogenase accessory sulfurtransferase FdhD [Deltaproteobacteria bacterium]|nr:formate dehydrogenase accessory sulfurtransferase FdhD [Deltaproteobacteria bacterium]